MSSELLSIVLDVVVLIFLGVTIYYALKLSRSLNNFRAYKEEFNGLIGELNIHIEQAYEAVKALKERSNRSADDLEYLLRESQKMSEELKIINQSSDNMASRLEKAASKGRAEPASFDNVDEPSFSIQDRDLSEDMDGDLQSEAEKDLYQALQKNKKSRMKRV